MRCTVGVDVGGTSIKIGKFYQDQLINKLHIPTNLTSKGAFILQEIHQAVEKIVVDDELEAIGFGLPGPVVNGWIIEAKNLGWGRFDFIKQIKTQYGNTKVYAQNDANCATIGEMAYGGGKNFKNFVFVTLGTGVGGGVVVNGELVEGLNGSAGEIGHLKVGFKNERQCTCGLYDCLEQYASATGIVITANAMRKGRNTKLNDCVVTSETIFQLAKEEDEVALEAVDAMIHKLGVGLSMVAAVVNPEAFVIGGGVSKSGDFLIERLIKKFDCYAFHSIENTQFVLAEMGNDAGIYGASYAARKYGV